MHILAVGVNYHSAPVHIREHLAFNKSGIEKALTILRNTKSIFEDVIISTCNRTEIYVVSDQLHTGRYYTKRFFAEWFHLSIADLEPFLFIKHGREAMDHLFRVTCGLDSMILGETQILGQVRNSFLTAQSAGTTGTFFNELFKEALTVARKAQHVTQINDHPVSVSYAAVEMLRHRFGTLEDKTVLMIGAGKMSRLALKHLAGNGAGDLLIANRTTEKAVHLAAQCGGRPVRFDRRNHLIRESDIVITATSAHEYLLTGKEIHSAMSGRERRPLILVDIGVPRNIDPEAGKIEGVFLSDIDDLKDVIENNREARLQAAKRIVPMIEQQMVKYEEWLQTLGVVPVITALRKKALEIHAETMTSLDHKLPEMTEHERKVISKHTKSMINQLLRDPISKIKELAVQNSGREAIRLFADIFHISDSVTSGTSRDSTSKGGKTAEQDETDGKTGKKTEQAVQIH